MGSLRDLLWQNVKYGIRSLRQTPVFSFVIIASLALGIGANTAIFSLLNAVMLKSLPVKEPHRLVRISMGPENDSFTNPIWEQVRDHQTAFDGVFAWSNQRFNLSTVGETRYVNGVLASGSFFDVLGVKARAGRTFTVDDDRRGCGPDGPVAVLSYGFAARELGGASEAIGKTISIDTHPFNVIGVTPASFYGIEVGRQFDVIAPICSEAILRGPGSQLDNRSSWWLSIFGRLSPGSALNAAQSGIRTLQTSVREATMPSNWPAEYLKDYLKDPFTLVASGNGLSQLRVRYTQALFVLMGIVVLVLFVGCANIANLLLARSTARSHEIAVRVSMGASRRLLLSQLMVENLMLALTGALAGIVVARWASRVLVAQLATATTNPFLDLSLDSRVLAFTTAAGVLTAILFGLFPAFRATAYSPAETLRAMTRSTASSEGGAGASRWLVSLQVAVSLVLIVGASLFIRTYSTLSSVNPGFNASDILLVNVDIRRAVTDAEQRLPLFERLLESIRVIPGVQKAALNAVTPISGSTWTTTVQVDGFQPAKPGDSGLFLNFVTPGYFETMETRIVAGRDFNSSDTSDSPKVAIINQTAAKHFFDAKNPIGQTYRTRLGGSLEWYGVEIVGIASDAKYRTMREVVPPTAYLPFSQNKPSGLGAAMIVRSTASASSLSPAITSAVISVSKDVPITYRTLVSQVEDSLVQERLMATLSALFGILALAVAAVGLAGVVSYSVSRRRAEIGIRAALGASARSLVWLAVRDIVKLTGVGLIAGTAISVALGRFVAAMLYGLTASDPTTIAVAIIALIAVAAISGYIPARRAASMDPLQCLRSQ